MSVDHRMASFHTLNPPSDLIESSMEACAEAGFGNDWSETETGNELRSFKTSYNSKTINITFDYESNISPHLVLIVNFREHLSPLNWKKDNKYKKFFDTSTDLLCRLYDVSNANYMGVFTKSEYDTFVPSDLPLIDYIEKIPPIGIYSESLLQDFGGLAGLFKEPRWEYSKPPWRVGELENGSLLVITHPRPWTDGGWTDSSYVDLRPGDEYL